MVLSKIKTSLLISNSSLNFSSLEISYFHDHSLSLTNSIAVFSLKEKKKARLFGLSIYFFVLLFPFLHFTLTTLLSHILYFTF